MRSSSGATEDRNTVYAGFDCLLIGPGGRLPGRLRIATSGGAPPGRRERPGGRPPGRPRIATRPAWRTDVGRRLAVVLREDRGSQRRVLRSVSRRRPLAVALRGDRGSQRTRAPVGLQDPRPWRSSSGTTEDRNTSSASTSAPGGILAVALRDDRGSQRPLAPRARAPVPAGGRPPGRPRIASGPTTQVSRRWRRRGGRPSGRPRIATCQAGERPCGRRTDGRGNAAGGFWRSSSGTTEDRNLYVARWSWWCVGWRIGGWW